MSVLYFYSPGTCSLSGMVVLEWLGLPYRLCRVEKEVRATEAFRKINPWGKVPAMNTDHHSLAENSCILQHLANQKPEANLSPAFASPKWDEMTQWLSYLASGFHAAFYPYFLTARYIQDPKLYPAVKEAALEQIAKQLDYVNGRLEKSEWLLGEQKSILDPYLYAMSRWAKSLFALPEKYPALDKHQKKLEADTAVQFALALEQGKEAVSPSGAFKGHIELAKV